MSKIWQFNDPVSVKTTTRPFQLGDINEIFIAGTSASFVHSYHYIISQSWKMHLYKGKINHIFSFTTEKNMLPLMLDLNLPPQKEELYPSTVKHFKLFPL